MGRVVLWSNLLLLLRVEVGLNCGFGSTWVLDEIGVGVIAGSTEKKNRRMRSIYQHAPESSSC